jgi:hypothetical protein
VKAEGIAGELSTVFAGVRGLLSSVLDLFTLEARRAGMTLVFMLACGAIARSSSSRPGSA